MKIKVGDLVELEKEEFSVWGIDRSNVGLVLAVSDETEPSTVTVLWNCERDSHEEYADGLRVLGGSNEISDR